MDGPTLEELARAVRAQMTEWYSTRSCIETTRTLIWCAAQAGLTVDPVPVRVTHHAPFWAVGVAGTGAMVQATKGWDGHLVGHVPSAAALIDASSDQFARPAKGLHVPCPFLAWDVTRDQLRAGRGWLNPATGVRSDYQEVDDTRWRLTPAWTARPHLIEQLGRAALAKVGIR